jgi:hypothetical protein
MASFRNLSERARAFYRERKTNIPTGPCNPANEGQRGGRYNGDTGEHRDRRPQAWNGLLLHRFFVRLVPENEFGISEQEPKPDRRHDNQADRRDEIPKAILGHRQRYRDRTTPQLNSLVKLDADAAG